MILITIADQHKEGPMLVHRCITDHRPGPVITLVIDMNTVTSAWQGWKTFSNDNKGSTNVRIIYLRAIGGFDKNMVTSASLK